MALDETTLEVIRNSGTAQQRRYAEKIAPLRRDGYMLLVTLLLASTIINETIPLVADRFLATGWEAVLLSTVLLLLFGEILPQAICTKYGLVIGGRMVWLVRLSQFVLFPIAYPAARLLERLLGQATGVVYKRAELKELVSIMGGKIELAPDEVRIIRGVLDLRDKHPALIMTVINQVFMLDSASVLDVHLMEELVARGYSRVPVFVGRRDNIIGMVLIKQLLSLSRTGPLPVSVLPIAPVPVVPVNMSLFAILRDFQQGKSHLAVVQGDEGFPIGIVTMEDIMEEMLQADIIDETDTPLTQYHGATSTLDVTMAARRRASTSLA
jgi:CBS domain containing-hemolysin-like protein